MGFGTFGLIAFGQNVVAPVTNQNSMIDNVITTEGTTTLQLLYTIAVF